MSLKYIVKCKYFGVSKTYYKDFISEKDYNNFKNWLNSKRGYTDIQFLKKKIESSTKIQLEKKIASKNNKESLKHYLLNNKKNLVFNKFIYCLIDKSEIVYVGKSSNVQNRLLQHKKEGIKEFTTFSIVAKLSPETSDEEVLKMEEKYIKLLKPKYNITHNVNN